MNNYIHVLDAEGKRITSIVDNMLVPIGKDALLKQAKEQYPDAAQYIYGGDAMLDAFLDGKVYKNGIFEDAPIIEYIPTKYEPRFKTLEEAQRRLLLMGKPTNAISAQYIKLNSEMVARIKEVQ